MKKFLLKGLFLFVIGCSVISCSDDDDNGGDPSGPDHFIPTSGAYILNSGSKDKIAGTLAYYDRTYSSTTAISDIFTNLNKIELGNTANDMVIYGSKMYIAMTNSNCIYITDLGGKILKYSDGKDAIIRPVTADNKPQQPRYAVADGGKVYVSMYSGHVARIDTTSMVIDKQASTGGTYPEQLTIVNSKLYVTNSGYGKGKTVGIIDLNTFADATTIETVLNPTRITKDKNNNIYVISMGNYGDIPSALQRINPADNTISTIGTGVATYMRPAGDRLLLINEVYDANWKLTVNLQYYDIIQQKVVKESFVKPGDQADLSRAFSLSVDPSNNDIYVGTSDYTTYGTMNVFDKSGNYKGYFKTGGVNPMGAYFITK